MSTAGNAPALALSEGTTGIIELARPEKFNCLSLAAFQAIDAARATFESDPAIRAILIRAQGRHFCTGADLDEVTETVPDAGRLDHFLACGMGVLDRLEASPLPVVVAVQGLCLAGGIELMLAADLAFAADTARFGDQHAQFGLVPGWGGSQRLVRLMGLRRALDLMFSARWLDAAEAQAAGLVNHVVREEELNARAIDYCATLATRSRAGLAEMKRLARVGADLPLPQALELERQIARNHLRGADAAEGLEAFRNRRQPRFD